MLLNVQVQSLDTSTVQDVSLFGSIHVRKRIKPFQMAAVGFHELYCDLVSIVVTPERVPHGVRCF